MSRALHLLDRRTLIAGLAALVPAGAVAATAALADPQRWLDYEGRLTARLRDAGGGGFGRAIARDLLAATNTVRTRDGAAPCEWDDDLAMAAQAHAADLTARNYVAHVTPEGFDPSHRLAVLARRRIGSAAENIAYRRNSIASNAANLMQVWRESPPHWRNLLNPAHRRAGFGVVTSGERTYAVGLYGHLDGELGAPLPFRLRNDADLDVALSTPPPEIDAFTFSAPTNDQPVARFIPNETPPLDPGVYQLRPRRRLSSAWIDVLWGPIFVKL